MWVRGETITDPEGEVIALWGAAQDISERKRIEAELIDAKKKAEVANIHKNYFLANMSHEIRTPMNGVVGFADLLKNDNISKEERNHFLNIIDENSKQLLNLIDDIVDVASIESNQLKITIGKCNVVQMLRGLQESFNNLKKQRQKDNINIKLSIPREYKKLTIETDGSRLQQVISNLLNNALKFSKEGTITYGFTVEDKKIQFFVKDEGIGIAEEELSEIFVRFKQLNYGKAEYGGTGLGLAICVGIVELLGGKITVSSKLGKGSEFNFDIPLKLFNEKSFPTLPQTDNKDYSNVFNGKRILIAEDEHIIHLYFKEIFRPFNVEVIFANNGREAVERYSPDVDIVLMDLRMPELNGFDATREIIKIDPNAKIIAQTAYVMNEEKEKCIESGCIGYLTKPISKGDLFKELEKHLS